MKLFTIYKSANNVHYKHNLLSFATAFVFCVNVSILIIPLFIPWSGHTQTEVTLLEEPMTSFNYKYLFNAELIDANKSQTDVICSSYDNYNRLTEQFQLCSNLKFSHEDINHDGKSDIMTFMFSFERFENTQIASFSLYLELQTTVKELCHFNVPAAVIVNHKIPLPSPAAGVFLMKGDLKVKQSNSLHCPYFMVNRKSNFNHKIINQNSSNLNDYRLTDAYSRLLNNPAFFYFEEQFARWNNDEDTDDIFRIELHIVDSMIRYQKTFWQLAIEFWIQYLAIFTVCYVLADNLKKVVFQNDFILTWKQIENKK